MLPSTGFKGHLGSKEYWPVYAEANRLGCCIGIHGGAHEGLGMDYLTPYAPINGLGHPFGQMVAFAGVVFNGLLDKYPNLRVGYAHNYTVQSMVGSALATDEQRQFMPLADRFATWISPGVQASNVRPNDPNPVGGGVGSGAYRGDSR